MLLAAQRQRRITASLAHQQLKVFDKTDSDHYCGSRDAQEKHYFKETHEKDGNQHRQRLYPFLV
jgi:hypothetical protein